MRNNFQAKTRAWKITLMVILILIFFVVLWILIGDIDVLDKDYIVAHNGILWQGTVTSTNYQWLIDKYPAVSSWLSEFLNKKAVIYNNTDLIIKANLIYWLLGCTALTMLLPIIGRLIKFNNWDLASYAYSAIFSMWVFIFSGLIPYFNSNNWLPSLWWLLRIFIFVVACGIFFLIFNKIFRFIIFKSPYAEQYVNELKSNKRIDDLAKKESKQTIDSYINKRNSDEITYIDVDIDNKEK